MGIFDFGKEKRSKNEIQSDLQQATSLKDLQNLISDSINSDEVQLTDDAFKNIPALKSSIELISNLIASLPIELYQRDKEGNTKEILNDKRLYLLNNELEEFYTSFQTKKAIVEDYLLHGRALLVMKNKGMGEYSYEYIPSNKVSFLQVHDSKDFDIIAENGKRYTSADLIYFFRNGSKISESKGILEENRALFTNIQYLNKYKQDLTKSNGANRIIAKPTRTLEKSFLQSLSNRLKALYEGRDNVLVLNSGIDIIELKSNSNFDLDKLTTTYDNQVANLTGVPKSVLDGSCDETTYLSFIRLTIVPLLRMLEQVINREFLTTKERENKFFKFSTDDLTIASLKHKSEYIQTLVNAGVLTTNNAREMLGYEPLPYLNSVLRLNLSDTLLDVETGKVFNINSNKVMDIETGEVTISDSSVVDDNTKDNIM